jgi:tetratricopeptide (TPR) repeat protein
VARRRFWYIVVLLPAIGIFQVGSQAVADRYTYLPLLGIFVLLCWGIPDVLPSFPRRPLLLGACGIAVVLLLAHQTTRQVRYWRDDTTLFTRALEINPGNVLGHYFLGKGLLERGASLPALNHFEAALKEAPLEFRSLFASGMALYGLGRHDEALQRFRSYLGIRPNSHEAHYNIGAILSRQGKPQQAIPHLEKALELKPGQPRAVSLLAQCRRQVSAWMAGVQPGATSLGEGALKGGSLPRCCYRAARSTSRSRSPISARRQHLCHREPAGPRRSDP